MEAMQKQSNTNTVETPCLFNMNEQRLNSVIGRDSEIQMAIEILSRKNKANPILVGEAGVGKTSIVEGIVNLIRQNLVPDSLRNKQVYTIDLSLLGTDIAQMKAVIDTVIETNSILFIDEIHNIIGAGQTHGSLDLANVLKPYLTNGLLTCIGATTNDEYTKYFERDSALNRRFSKIDVKEPSVENAIMMVDYLKPTYESYHNLSISDEAVINSVTLAKRYLSDKKLPDIAFDLIDEACSYVSVTNTRYYRAIEEMKRYENEGDWEQVARIKHGELPELIKAKNDKVTKEIILRVISNKTGIPVQSLSKGDKQKLLELEDTLKKRVIGQDEALTKIADHVRTSRLGIKQRNSSFILLGKSGVGKTETAKALNYALFNSEDILRFDMSEYQHKHDVSKLIGAPAGYVGYEEGGILTNSVRRKPYAVILFDEIEKAHPDIFDTMLQILDEGAITDNKGMKVDFKNTVILMTSNLSETKLKEKYRAEFLNRVDEVIQFNDLNEKDVEKITHLKLNTIASKIEKEYPVRVEISSHLINKIIDRADVASYGARDIDRLIHKCVEVPLSKKLLSEEIKNGQLVILT